MASTQAQSRELDRLQTLVDVYVAATREEDRAQSCRGAVGQDVRESLAEAGRSLREDLARPSALPAGEVARRLRLLSAIEGKLVDIEEQDMATGLEVTMRIQDSMVRLRECDTPQRLVEAAPAELCRALGFSRALISRVKWSIWVPEVLEVRGGDAPQAEIFRAFVERNTIPLSHMLMESALVRRGIPVLVTDARADPRTYKPIVDAAGSDSYVAAPIIPAGRVIGFLHADRYGQELPVSTVDRDHLWLFAEHFGLLYERAILVGRLEKQRLELRRRLTSATETIDRLCLEEIELARDEVPPEIDARGPVLSRVDDLLTRREREVLELMVRGATNARIAAELVITEGTVKSHVKRILRKLRVHNRAEAVVRYLGLLRLEHRPPR